MLPKGLYARSALIVIAPMVILQCVLTYVFMERHWQLVTTRLSTVLTQDIAAVIDLYHADPQEQRAHQQERPAEAATVRRAKHAVGFTHAEGAAHSLSPVPRPPGEPGSGE